MLKNIIRVLAVSAALASASAVYGQPANPPPSVGAYGPVSSAVGPQFGNQYGSYSKGMACGTMAAGLASNSPIFSFRYGGTGNAVIRRVTISAANAGTGFAAGVGNFSLYFATAFTASDSGGTAGTLTNNQGDLRTSFPATQVSDFRIATTGTLTAGTRTLTTDATANLLFPTSTTASINLTSPGTSIYNQSDASFYPLVLANNEGFVIQATVPATGTWSCTVTVDWEEFTVF